MLHTQTTKLATEPGRTCEADNDWTRTQSCGVLGFGAGVGDVLWDGVGVGVGVADVGLTDGVGVELGDVLPVLGVGSAVAESEGVLVGLALVPVLSLGLGLAVSDGLAVPVELELGPAVPDDVGCASALASGTIRASRAALFGRLTQGAFATGPAGVTGPPTSAARACPSMLEETNAKPVRAPTTAGLMTRCALTQRPHFVLTVPGYPMPTLCAVRLDAPGRSK